MTQIQTPQANDALKNPPIDQTKMTNAPSKKTKIRALQDIYLGSLGRVVKAGEEIDAEASEVKEFCDTKIQGPYSFDGERSDKSATRSVYRRAVRMSEVEAAAKLAKERSRTCDDEG